MKIIYNNINLIETFGDILSALEILFLINDLKPLVRLKCSYNQLIHIKEFCRKNGLFVLSKYKLVSFEDKNKGYSNKCDYVPIGHPGGYHVIFISKNKETCNSASKPPPNIIKSEELGFMLGYPECCTKFYNENKEKAASKQMDFVLFTPKSKKPFPFYNNVCLRYFGINLISHFPCSFHCKESIKLAKKNLEFLKNHLPEIANYFTNELKSFIIYTEYQGVHYSADYKINNNKVRFDYLKSTADTQLRKELNDSKEIIMEDFNHFNLNNKEYKSDELRLFFFR